MTKNARSLVFTRVLRYLWNVYAKTNHYTIFCQCL
uniref:Uncharacterized protein n=1 Tax=Caudovirales sp. ctIZM3 TaxID=2827633 RepID=A0A8S5T8V6_9CAUD|nr:MAG TPA: hypothetical protein [Caudovirales sp. ctIZM3]